MTEQIVASFHSFLLLPFFLALIQALFVIRDSPAVHRSLLNVHMHAPKTRLGTGLPYLDLKQSRDHRPNLPGQPDTLHTSVQDLLRSASASSPILILSHRPWRPGERAAAVGCMLQEQCRTQRDSAVCPATFGARDVGMRPGHASSAGSLLRPFTLFQPSPHSPSPCSPHCCVHDPRALCQ